MALFSPPLAKVALQFAAPEYAARMLNMPGDPSSLVICIAGHPMARQGRAGPDLCIAALGFG